MQIVLYIFRGRLACLNRVALMLGVVAIVSGILLLPSSASAAGSGSPGAAVLAVAGPNPFPAQLSSPSKTGFRSATIHPVILNTGTATAYVTFSASLDVSDGDCANPAITVTSGKPAPVKVPAGASAAPLLTMTVKQYCPGIDGTITMVGGTGVSPVSFRFAFTSSVQEKDYWYPIAGGPGAGFLFLVVMLIIVRTFRGRFGKLGDVVATGSSWSFASSWLTNITALGAVLGTVLGAAGFLADVLPGTDTGRFTGLSVLFGAFVITAPIIYTATSKWVFISSSGAIRPPSPARAPVTAPVTDPATVTARAADRTRIRTLVLVLALARLWTRARTPDPNPAGSGSAADTLVSVGRVWGVIAAAAVTLAGVIGQLGTLAVLAGTAQGDDGAKDFVFAVLAAAAALTLCYSVAFVLGVSRQEITGDAAKLAPSSSGTL